jgi:predicted nucleotidyltransferase
MMPNNLQDTGLTESVIARINAVFAEVPEIEQVILYGSRAKGTFRNGSDIDLVIKGEAVDHSSLLRTERELDDLLLPYTIDLSLFHLIDNQELLDHIRRVGVVFYERNIP